MNTIESLSKPLSAADLSSEADFWLGSLHCRPSLLIVSADGRSETLERRVMLVLVVLARHQGEVMSRERLLELCWNGRVVGDDAIQRCMVHLRKVAEALGGFKLETIRGVGYRLVEIVSPAVAGQLPAPRTADAGRIFSGARASWVMATALVVLTGVALFIAPKFGESPPVITTPPAAVLTEIADLIDRDLYGKAFSLAQPLRSDASVQSDELEPLWRQIVLPIRPSVEQDGATLWFKPYEDIEGPWLYGGVSPFTDAFDAPRGPLRLKIEKAGFRTGYFTVANPGPSMIVDGPLKQLNFSLQDSPVTLSLIEEGTLPEDMVLVPHTDIPVTLGGWTRAMSGEYRMDMPAFGIARFEVTNQQFKEFVDAGGYEDSRWWDGLEFREGGQLLSWEEARKRFVDTTDRPGPAGWQLSSYPTGAAQMPVGGISWYEASAYARFRGLMLPTIHHWARAALSPFDVIYGTSPAIAMQSHFSSEEPVAANAEVGLGPWGTFHTSGNAGEWVLNFSGDSALILGGNWSEDPNEGVRSKLVEPMARELQYGMRLMLPPDGTLPAEWTAPVTLLTNADNNITREPIDDLAFTGMMAQFPVNSTELRSQTVEVIEQNELWVAEEVNLAYANAQATTLIVVRPRNAAAPLHPVIYGPPNACCILNRPNRDVMEMLARNEFVVKGGRALVLPIWTQSYARFQQLAAPGSEERVTQDRDISVGYFADIRNTISYLQSREDMDVEHLGYIGMSLGAGSLGAVVLAAEPRFKAAVFISGGITPAKNLHPMHDMVNYAPHITTPVLMLNGRFDHIETQESQNRLFELMGASDDDKRHVRFDGSHVSYPVNSLAREVSDWFDLHLGPVARGAVLADQR